MDDDLAVINGDLSAIYAIKLSNSIPTMKNARVAVMLEILKFDLIWKKMDLISHDFQKDDYRIKVQNKIFRLKIKKVVQKISFFKL
jgi:hypothetical protein